MSEFQRQVTHWMYVLANRSFGRAAEQRAVLAFMRKWSELLTAAPDERLAVRAAAASVYSAVRAADVLVAVDMEDDEKRDVEPLEPPFRSDWQQLSDLRAMRVGLLSRMVHVKVGTDTAWHSVLAALAVLDQAARREYPGECEGQVLPTPDQWTYPWACLAGCCQKVLKEPGLSEKLRCTLEETNHVVSEAIAKLLTSPARAVCDGTLACVFYVRQERDMLYQFSSDPVVGESAQVLLSAWWHLPFLELGDYAGMEMEAIF